ncbi:MAG: hypothetical protein PHW32_01190 [Bacilli bacterium]|nr:hypothetical protein [Bacilli bacterium]MDD4283145.1 hypothetical protein [Bacilli bacterium]MDD4719121.1 hypothetical protein [Bacilli bacterium]
MNNVIINYIAPFMIASSSMKYVFYKINNKKIISNFDNIKIGKRENIKNTNNIPIELEGLVNTLENNINKKNLNNLYNNLQSIQVNKNFKMLLMGISGKYNSEKNTIDYSIDGSIEHEFIHMASSHWDNEEDIKQSGFVNYAGRLTYGKALNEGYTDLVTRRLFDKTTRFYDDEVRITQFLELLLGSKNMEKYYFNNNLPSLLNHLSNYMDKEDAIKFITTLDYGFELKKLFNPAYKLIYTNLELKLCTIFKEHNKSLLKQIEYLKLLDETIITKAIVKTKKI